MKGALRFPLFAAAAVAVSAYVNLLSTNVTDYDFFYHLRHASLYLSEGLFMKEFPWAAYSAINRFSADIWYGFHLLLIPVTLLPESTLQIKAAPIFILTLFFLVFYFAASRGQLSYPYLWPFVLLFSAAVFIERLVMARPHILSMGLSALLLSVMIGGGLWAVFLASLGLTFIHLSFFWLAILIGVVVSLVRLCTERVFEWRKAAAVLLGLTAGWLLRPNPFGAAELVYVQIFQLAAEKQHGLEGFGTELNRLEPRALILLSPFILIWLSIALAAIFSMFRRKAELSGRERTFLWSGLLLSFLFFGTTLLGYQRTIDQWSLFAVIFIASGFTCFLDPRESRPKQAFGRRMRVVSAAIAVVVCAIMVWMTNHSYTMYIRGPRAARPYRMRATAEWLKEHSKPGEIVFHADWGLFPDLFYWNPQNHYVGGMDPIFQYSYDSGLFWKARHLAANQLGALTCGTANVETAQLEDTYTVLRRDFKASYLLVQKFATPLLYSYALENPRFIPRFYDGRVAIFELDDAAQVQGD
jgi:hypothetical protein